jgi:peptidyl-prolyl cis-trans isomerase A (cyclophilin A)
VGASDTCSYSYGNVSDIYPNFISPDIFQVTFSTNILMDGRPAKPIVMEVHRDWAPIGSDRFYALVQDKYYDCAAFFRVVPNFVIQYGIAASPKETEKWNVPLPDDPVLVSNLPWTVSYATGGPDTRTTQIFINLINNSRLDAMGFAPFAVITSGFDTILAINNPTPGDSNGVDQDNYTLYGNDWILPLYPNISVVSTATFIDATENKADALSVLAIVLITGGVVALAAMIAYKCLNMRKTEEHIRNSLKAIDEKDILRRYEGVNEFNARYSLLNSSDANSAANALDNDKTP